MSLVIRNEAYLTVKNIEKSMTFETEFSVTPIGGSIASSGKIKISLRRVGPIVTMQWGELIMFGITPTTTGVQFGKIPSQFKPKYLDQSGTMMFLGLGLINIDSTLMLGSTFQTFAANRAIHSGGVSWLV